MELEEAIENLKVIMRNRDSKFWIGKNGVEAIDIVLKELDNRIPVSEIEKILEATKQLREKEIKELGMSLRGSAVDILESILKKYKE